MFANAIKMQHRPALSNRPDLPEIKDYQIAVAKQTTANKDENLELLFEYFQSEAFRHRFEAFAEGITQMQIDLDFEKRSMERVWKKRDIQIKRMVLNASRMYGELQGIMGNTLPDIKVLTLSEGDKK